MTDLIKAHQHSQRVQREMQEAESSKATLSASHRTSGTGFPDCVVSYLTWLEIVFYTVLEAFAFGLQGGHDETVSHKVSRVANPFTRAKTVEDEEMNFSKIKLFQITK